MAPTAKPLTLTNGGALMAPADRMVEYTPFQERDPIKLSVAIVKNYIASPTKSGALPSDAACMRFVMLCKARQLNPFAGDAYLVGYDSGDGPQFQLIVAHQSLLKRAEVHPEYDGMESGVMVRRKVVDDKGEERSVTMDLEGDYIEDGDAIVGAWACVHFRTRRHPMRDRLKLSTFNTGRSRWKADPAGMIVKCVEASCLRRAFPTVLGGLFLTEHGAAFEPSAPVLLPRSDFSRTGRTGGGPMQRFDLDAQAAPESDEPTTAQVDEGLEREARVDELDQEIKEAETLAACDRAHQHILDAEDLIGHQAAMSLRTALAGRRTALGLGSVTSDEQKSEADRSLFCLSRHSPLVTRHYGGSGHCDDIPGERTMFVMAKVTIPTPKQIKALRVKLGLTQAEAAEKVGSAQGIWAAWETGRRKPSRQSALLIDLLRRGII